MARKVERGTGCEDVLERGGENRELLKMDIQKRKKGVGG